MKVVISTCYGGFGLSAKAIALLVERGEKDPDRFDGEWINRSDSNLISVVEELGSEADDRHANLEIVEIPDGTEYQIEEYDGWEWVAEKHRTWHGKMC